MTDITERLRQNARSVDCFSDPYPDVLTDAADEIDRLRAELDAFHASSVIRSANVLLLEAHNARMRAYIERVAECPCCHETQTCVQECTFENDDWHEWDAMMTAREALYGRTQGKTT